MDEIIYLEPDEEITSVIDKIKNAQNARLGLVLPKDATLLQSVVNLRLLQREATFLKKEIAIVTTDKIGRNLASQIGLTVFNSIKEEKPIFTPPQPIVDPSEVIELDMTPKVEAPEKVPGVNVHHFQEKPIMWKKNSPPEYRGEVSKITPTYEPSKAIKPSITNNLNNNFSVRKPEKDLKNFKKLIWPMVIILLLLVGVATYLLLPRATVTIIVPSEDLKKEVSFAVQNQIKTVDLTNNSLPGELVQVSDEKKESFPATGEKKIGTKASGTISLYNTLDSSGHSLPANAQLSSSGKTFVLKSAVTIPGAGVSGGSIVPGTIKADVEAVENGAEFNIKSGRFTILSLPSAQQAGIYGQSSSDMAGGMSKIVQVVSQQDWDSAKNKLVSELTEKTKNDLNNKITNKKVLDKALIIPDPTVNSTIGVGQEAQKFEMKVALTQQVMIFDYEQMKDFLVLVLQKQVPAEKMVAIASDSDIGLNVTKTAYDKAQLDITANINAKIAPKMDVDMIKTNILGKSSADTKNIIKNQSEVRDVNIDYWPALWFKRIPNLSRNVTVRVEYQLK